MELVGLGNNCIDYLARVPALVDFDENGQMLDLTIACGGQATTAMVTAQRLGAATSVIGTVGDDEFGTAVLETLCREGVRHDLMRVVPGGRSQIAVVLVNAQDGRRAIMARRGPGTDHGLTDADRARIAAARVLLLDGGLIELAEEAARWAQAHGVAVLLDAGPMRSDMRTLVSLTDYLITSAGFPRRFFPDVGDYDEAASRFLALGPKVVVTTLGDKGSRTWTRDGSFSRPAFTVPVVDSTGAGDVFHGAYAYGVARGWDLHGLADFASACAAMKCRAMGGQAGIPSLPQLEAFLSEHGVTPTYASVPLPA